MFRRRSPIVLVLLASLGLPPALAPAWAAGADQRSLDEVRARIEQVQRKLEAGQAERDVASREVQTIERRIADASASLRTVKKRIDAQAQRVRETQAERAEAQAALATHRAALAQQLRAAYIMGRGAETQMLLNLDDAQSVGRMLSYQDYLQQAQFAAIAAIKTRASELEALAARLQQEQAELEQLRREQEGALADLQKGRGERAEALTALKTELASEARQLKQLQEDERSIRKLIESVRKKLADLPPDVTPSDKAFTAQKGKLPWPARGALLAHYGEAKAGGKLSWNGHWIGVADGSPVRAVARGRAVYVGWMHRYGLIALIEHDSGYYTLYGHCQSVGVAVGDTVQPGQTIASAGNTGGYDHSGVYFEIRKGTAAIDPRLWLAR